MLRHVLFDLELFSSEADRENSQKRVLFLLHALMNCDRLYLRNHPETPLIYQAGIKYKLPAQLDDADVPEINTIREYLKGSGAPSSVLSAVETLSHMTGGGETFREIPRIIENGGGDCDNVAAWRAAELRELGILAQPMITWRKRPDGGMTYHVIVAWPDGTSEDPSLLLGMGGADRAAERAEEERKLRERTTDFVNGLSRTPRLSGVEDVKRVCDDVLGEGRRMERLTGLPRQATVVSGGCEDDAPGGHMRRAVIAGLPPMSPQPGGFGQGLQYSIPFMTDDAYEDWSPTRPAEFYYNPQYPGGLIQQTPHFNTLWRDADDDWENRFDDVDGDFAGASGVAGRGVGRGRRGLDGLKFRMASSKRRAGL